MLIIEKFTVDDYFILDNWIQSEEELVQFAGPFFKFPLTIEQIEHYLGDEKRQVFKFISHDIEIPIGLAELYSHSKEANKVARVLIGDKSYRGKGIGTQLIHWLVEYSFQHDEKKWVILNVYDWNEAAIRCYEKVGFKRTIGTSMISKVGKKMWKAIEMKVYRDRYTRNNDASISILKNF